MSSDDSAAPPPVMDAEVDSSEKGKEKLDSLPSGEALEGAALLESPLPELALEDDHNKGEKKQLPSSSIERAPPEPAYPLEIVMVANDSRRKLNLISSDGARFLVGEAVALQSTVLENMIHDGCEGNIPIAVKADDLRRVLRYCRKKAEWRRGTWEDRITFKDWEERFVSIGAMEILDLLTAANILGVRSLRRLLHRKIAAMLNEMTNALNHLRQF